MHRFHKRLTALVFVALIISGLVLYFTIDISTFANLTAFRPWSLALALIFLLMGLFFDGTRLYHLVKLSGETIDCRQIRHVVLGNYFLAMLMPGTAGGAVAQVMFLRKAGIPLGKATVLVVARTIMSLAFMLICLPFILHFDNSLLPWVSESNKIWIIVAGIISLAVVLIMRLSFANNILLAMTKRLSSKKRRKVFQGYREIKGAVLLLATAPINIMRIFIESVISLLALYMVVPALFWGLGVNFDLLQIMGRMIFLNLIVYFAPTPGGSGVAEGGFIFLFNEFLPTGTVGIAAVVWRIFVEYLPFMAGFYYLIKTFGRDMLH